MTLPSSRKRKQRPTLTTSFLKQSNAVIKHQAALKSILSLTAAPACSKATILCLRMTRVGIKRLRRGSYQKCVFDWRIKQDHGVARQLYNSLKYLCATSVQYHGHRLLSP